MSSRPMKQPRVLIALAADTKQNASSSVKYRYLIQALEERFQVNQKINAQPKHLLKLILIALAFNRNKAVWRERIHKNYFGFLFSSYRVNQRIKRNVGKLDFSLQIGCLFDASWPNKHKPNFIYTDYTSALSAQNPEAGRSPFSPWELRKWLVREKSSYQSAEHIFVRSNLVRKSIIEDYGITEEKITVVGGGWNFSQPPAEVQRSFSGTINILFIGKRFYRKGGDILLSAYKKLNQAVPNTTLTIVTNEVLPEFNEVDHITVLEPIWDRRKIHQLYQDSHLFVLPSRLETWGDVLLEAMAYGVPCIGFNTDAMPEIIDNGVNGCISSQMDADGLFSAMLGLVKDPQKIQKMSQAAREISHRKYSWGNVVDKMKEVIEENYLPDLDPS